MKYLIVINISNLSFFSFKNLIFWHRKPSAVKASRLKIETTITEVLISLSMIATLSDRHTIFILAPVLFLFRSAYSSFDHPLSEFFTSSGRWSDRAETSDLLALDHMYVIDWDKIKFQKLPDKKLSRKFFNFFLMIRQYRMIQSL